LLNNLNHQDGLIGARHPGIHVQNPGPRGNLGQGIPANHIEFALAQFSPQNLSASGVYPFPDNHYSLITADARFLFR
jgi:hypothetical protein